ncbi:hypothetical protein C8Q77DRAFT_1092407 [Trametes polyzona]|nr:hypothetical protein C8Q77DRAFT_1092407 [Trametes polyzona]
MGGDDLLVTEDARVMLDVSRCRLNRLPNIVLLYEWTIDLNSTARKLVRGVKRDPFKGAPKGSRKRRDALNTLWRQVASFTSYEREETLLWNPRTDVYGHGRVVCPGQCFLSDSGAILDGMCYSDRVRGPKVEVKFGPGVMRPVQLEEFSREDDDGFSNPDCRRGTNGRRGGGKGRKQQRSRMPCDSRKPFQVKDERLFHGVLPRGIVYNDRQLEPVAGQWRRYTVPRVEFGWTLHTKTVVEGKGDFAGWLINQGPALYGLDIDLNHFALATKLTFLTETYLVAVFDGSGRRTGQQRQKPTVPARTLYFYERVHERLEASMAMDGWQDWPWAYWSTKPDDRLGIIERLERTHTAETVRKQSITYLGVLPGGLFRWVQIVDGCYMMNIDVRVKVEYCKYTPDEVQVLHEIATEEKEPVAYDEEGTVSRSAAGSVGTPGGPTLSESKPPCWNEFWEVEDITGETPAVEYDRKRERRWYDEKAIAQALYWLRVAKEDPRRVVRWEPGLGEEHKKRTYPDRRCVRSVSTLREQNQEWLRRTNDILRVRRPRIAVR